jgi:hypothetical protein
MLGPEAIRVRVLMVLLCFIAALSATPLRQAEAASDFARLLDDLAAGLLVEGIDGGVGDDAGETVLKNGSPSLESPAGAFWISCDRQGSTSPCLIVLHEFDRPPIPEHPPRRIARLVRLLF